MKNLLKLLQMDSKIPKPSNARKGMLFDFDAMKNKSSENDPQNANAKKPLTGKLLAVMQSL